MSDDGDNKMVKSNLRHLSLVERVTVGAVGMSLLSVFMPWARVLVFSYQGTDSDWGIIIGLCSVLALLLFAFDIEQVKNKSQQRDIATGLCAVNAVLYLYCAIRFADVIDVGGDASLLWGVVSFGVGMYVGVISSVAALTMLVVDRISRGKEIGMRFRVCLIAGAVGVVSLAVSRWGVLSIVAACLAFGLLVNGRKTVPRRVFSAGAAVLALTFGGGVGRVVSTNASSRESSPKCVELMAEGADVAAVEEATTCVDKKGNATFLMTMTNECKSGKVLVYNDEGWGYRGEKWTKIGEAPVGRCNSSATEQCSDIFKAGKITQKSWTSVNECLDGNDVKILFTMSMPCFLDDREYVYNEYGWGFVGKPWNRGSDSPNC